MAAYSFRLLAFNPYDKTIIKEDDEQVTEAFDKKNSKEFLVQMFGINEKGETACIFVEGYTPFFYIKVSDQWTDSHRVEFMLQLAQDLGESAADDIVGSSFIKRKQLYGFDGGKEHNFILIRFKNEAAFKKAEKLWFNIQSQTPTRPYKKTLKPKGYLYKGISTFLYESQIPSVLRLFHIKEMSPSGWIALPQKHTVKLNAKTTSCTYEFSIKYNHIIAQPQKETPVPYKICSFDIEASSSHGDFPLAIKNYKKLASMQLP